MPKTLNLTDLISVNTLEKFQNTFSEATNIGSIIRDINGNPLTKGSRLSDLWTIAMKNPTVHEESHNKLMQIFKKCQKSGQIEIYNKYLDTYACVVPIFLEGKIIAFFIGGLVRFGNPNVQICSEEAQKIDLEIDDFLEKYLALPLVTKERLLSCASLFKMFASTISTLAKEGTVIKSEKLSIEKKFIDSKRALMIAESRYKTLFHTINDGVYMTDIDEVIIDMNHAGANIFGYEPHELIGTNVRRLYANPSSRDEFLEPLHKNGHIEGFRPVVVLKNGSTRVIETNATIIKDEHGAVIGVQGIFRIPREFRDQNSLREHQHLSDLHNKDDSRSTSIKEHKNHQIPS